MTKKNVAVFGQTHKTGFTVASTSTSIANNTSVNSFLIAKAGTEGALVNKISAIPRGTTTATALYTFIRQQSDSSTLRQIIDCEPMPAFSADATKSPPVVTFKNITEETPLRLQAGDELHVGIGVAVGAGIAFYAEWTDL